MTSLLCLSNGHGEDAIAVQILQALQRLPGAPEIAALPLVGEGAAYRAAGIPLAGEARSLLPSGGFLYMDGRQLWRDLRGGLLGLTWSQWRSLRGWYRTASGAGDSSPETLRDRDGGASDRGEIDRGVIDNRGEIDRGEIGNSGAFVLAVGDIVPLAFAWASGARYGFVGTAKSEYYLRDGAGNWLRSRRLEGWSGSVYLPWERWLLARSRCRGAFLRDGLTASVLRRWPIPAFDAGNPMMDGFAAADWRGEPPEPSAALQVALLPGSRPAEAGRNWATIARALAELADGLPERSPWGRAAIAPGLDLETLRGTAIAAGWRPGASPSVLVRGTARLTLEPGNFRAIARAAHLAIAMAGTATEQVVGLGRPVLALAGTGPQFTPAFAEAQTRLLGPSVMLLDDPASAPAIARSLLADPARWRQLAENGRQRMGPPGAADRIARHLRQILSESEIGNSESFVKSPVPEFRSRENARNDRDRAV